MADAQALDAIWNGSTLAQIAWPKKIIEAYNYEILCSMGCEIFIYHIWVLFFAMLNMYS